MFFIVSLRMNFVCMYGMDRRCVRGVEQCMRLSASDVWDTNESPLLSICHLVMVFVSGSSVLLCVRWRRRTRDMAESRSISIRPSSLLASMLWVDSGRSRKRLANLLWAWSRSDILCD